jgi:hypothetical protein
MYNILLASAFLCIQLFFPANTRAQGTEKLIQQHSIDWMQALERNDTVALESWLATGFFLGGVGDKEKIDRQTWLKNAADREWSRTHYEFVDVKVFGEQWAAVNARLQFRASPLPFTITTNIIDFWNFRNGRWQVTERLVAENSITSFLHIGTGFVAGVVLTLLVVWIIRFNRNRRKQRTTSAIPGQSAMAS